MNDELKGILSYLKKKENTRRIKCITIEESKQLLDYIINLQQENERLKENALHNDKVVDKAKGNENIYKSRIDEAIQYIKCHTFLHDDYGNEYYTMGEYFNPYWCINILEGNDEGFETLKTFVDYKERVRKAIEYIEKEYQDNIIITDYADNPITPQELYGELLDILKGDSNETV